MLLGRPTFNFWLKAWSGRLLNFHHFQQEISLFCNTAIIVITKREDVPKQNFNCSALHASYFSVTLALKGLFPATSGAWIYLVKK